MITYAVESFTDTVDELIGKMHHWKEILPSHPDIPFVPDWDRMEALDAQGVVLLVTARDGASKGALIGYSVTVLSTHFHHAESLFGMVDSVWLDRDYRHGFSGIELIRMVEKAAAEKGAKKLLIASKLRDDVSIRPVLLRLGFKPEEEIYGKALV